MRNLLPYILLSASTVISVNAELIEKWTFSEANGSSLRETLSNQSSYFASVSKGTAQVQDGKLCFTAEGTDHSIFLINEFGCESPQSGVYEVSWTYTDAVFSQTAIVGGKANAGFDVRDTSGTRHDGKDDVILGGVRLSFEKDHFEVQYQDSTTSRYTEIAKVDAVTLPTELHVRAIFDLNKAGEPGSMQVFLQLGDEKEIHPLVDGMIPAGVNLTGYRVFQQITNGGTNWQRGDSLCIDDLAFTKITGTTF